MHGRSTRRHRGKLAGPAVEAVHANVSLLAAARLAWLGRRDLRDDGHLQLTSARDTLRVESTSSTQAMRLC